MVDLNKLYLGKIRQKSGNPTMIPSQEPLNTMVGFRECFSGLLTVSELDVTMA